MWDSVANDNLSQFEGEKEDVRLRKARSLASALTQKAHIPPKANANWKRLTAALPFLPKQWSIISIYVWRPDNLELRMMSRMVQSVSIASPTRRTTPATKPDCLMEYGNPTIPAPKMELAMFVVASKTPAPRFSQSGNSPFSVRPVDLPTPSTPSSTVLRRSEMLDPKTSMDCRIDGGIGKGGSDLSLRLEPGEESMERDVSSTIFSSSSDNVSEAASNSASLLPAVLFRPYGARVVGLGSRGLLVLGPALELDDASQGCP